MTPEKYMSYVAICRRDPDACWEWPLSRNPSGYGRIAWNGHSTLAHRVAAHLAHGLDLSDPDLRALHRCDNPPCINPAHLFIGTQADNVADMHAKGRWKPRPRDPWRPSPELYRRMVANMDAMKAGGPMPYTEPYVEPRG